MPANQKHGKPDEQHEIVQHRRHARSKKIVERVHVRRRTRHQPAHRRAIEKAHRQPLQMLKNLFAQVIHCLLPDGLHDAHLQILKRKTRDQ